MSKQQFVLSLEMNNSNNEGQYELNFQNNQNESIMVQRKMRESGGEGMSQKSRLYYYQNKKK